MVEFQLDERAAQRLLGAVSRTLAAGGALSPERKARFQALAERLGLGAKAIARARRAPDVEAPATRAEAEATFVAAAIVLGAERSAGEDAALGSLGGELELGLAARELEELARATDALRCLRRKQSASDSGTRRGSGPPPRARAPQGGATPVRRRISDRASPAGASASGRSSNGGGASATALPVHLLAAVLGATALLVVLGLLVFGGREQPDPRHGGQAVAEAAASGGEWAEVEATWRALSDGSQEPQPSALTALRARLEELAARSGDPETRRRAGELLGSSGLARLDPRTRGELVLRTDEAIEAAVRDGRYDAAIERLNALPPAMRLFERSWFQKREAELERWKQVAGRLDAFRARVPRADLATLREALVLHDEARAASASETKEFYAIVDWFRAQRHLSRAVLAEEVRLWRAKDEPGARSARLLLELLEPDLRSFLGSLKPAELLEVILALPAKEGVDAFTFWLPPESWASLPVEPWLDLISGQSGRDRVSFARVVPRAQWARVPGPRLLALLDLPPLPLLELAVLLPGEAWSKLPAPGLADLLKRQPMVLRDLVLRLLPRGQLQAVQELLPAPAAPDAGVLAAGTGFFVAPQLVLTNAHVVGQAKVVQVRWGEQTVEGRVRALGAEPELDLALVEVPVRGQPLLLCEPAISRMRPVWAYGFGAMGGFDVGGQAPVSPGTVLAIHPAGAWIVFSGHVNPGNSGGPLIDAAGRWVGVVTRKSIPSNAHEESVGIALHGGLVARWLEAQGVGPGRAPELPPEQLSPEVDGRVLRSVVQVFARQ